MGARARRRLLRVALALGAALATLAVAELALRLTASPSPPPGGNAPAETVLTTVEDPVLGWIFPPDTTGVFRSGSHPTPVRTNSLGLRGAPLPVDDEAPCVVVLGDSYAFGWGVAEEASFPALLAEELGDRLGGVAVRTVNAGVPGYAPRQQAALLRRLLEVLEPDAVVATFSLANDPVDERRLDRYWPDRLTSYRPDIRDPGSLSARLIRRSRLLSLLDDSTWNLRWQLANASGEGVALAESSLAALAGLCREEDLPLLLAVVPRASEVTGTGGLPGRVLGRLTARVRRRVRDRAAALDLPAVDLRSVLGGVREREPAYLTRDSHWTPAGHRAVAAELARALLEIWTPPGDG